jgi:hypothetical protein
MTAATGRPMLAVGALALLVAVAGATAAAAAVDSPRLEEVTCQGLRVRQTGLPAGTPFVVEVADPQTGREFARREARSSGAGALDIRITADFAGAGQLVVEVETEQGGQEVEFAEAIHEFERPCPAAQAGRSSGRRTGLAVAAAVTVAVLVLTLVAVVRALGLLGRGAGR